MGFGAVLGAFGLGTAAAIVAPAIARGLVETTQVARGTATPWAQSQYYTPAFIQSDIAARKAVAEQISTQGPVRAFTFNIPGARAFTATEYQQEIKKQLESRGYDPVEANTLAIGAQELYRAESAGELSGAIGISTGSEAFGGSLAQKGLEKAAGYAGISAKAAPKVVGLTVAKAAGIAGIYEGAGIELTRQVPEMFFRQRPLDVGQLGLATAGGAATAASLGGIISYGYTKYAVGGIIKPTAAQTAATTKAAEAFQQNLAKYRSATTPAQKAKFLLAAREAKEIVRAGEGAGVVSQAKSYITGRGTRAAASVIDPLEYPTDILAARVGWIAGGKKGPEVGIKIAGVVGGGQKLKLPKQMFRVSTPLIQPFTLTPAQPPISVQEYQSFAPKGFGVFVPTQVKSTQPQPSETTQPQPQPQPQPVDTDVPPTQPQPVDTDVPPTQPQPSETTQPQPQPTEITQPTETTTTDITTNVTMPVVVPTTKNFPWPPLLPPIGGGDGGGNVLRKGTLLYYNELAEAQRALRRLL